jgi:hypothetical protein
MNTLRTALTWLLVTIAFDAYAAGGPIVRTRITPGSVVIGQPVTLAVDILVPTWFGGAIEYPSTIAIPDVVAKLSDEHSVNLNERIGDASYAGMTRTYLIVPQKAGAFEVPAITIRVPYSVDGKTVMANVRTMPLRFEAKLPAGAADLGYFIATRSYRLTQQAEPSKLIGFKVGDALTRRITQRATDLAPMFLPALKFEDVDGLEIYPADPVLEEQGGERGAARVATRTDAATYMLAKPGNYRLPGLRIGWFDPDQAAMRWAEVPELAFEVAPNPVLVANAPAVTVAESRATSARFANLATKWREALLTVLLLLTAGLALRRLAPAALQRLREWRLRRAASEAAAFRRVRIAARGADGSAVVKAAAQWCALIAPGDERMTLRQFVHFYGDDRLAAQVDGLERMLYRDGRDPGTSWPFREFLRGLAAARGRWQQSPRAVRHLTRGLAPLNPGYVQ